MWHSTIRLIIPGTLEHRDLAVRVVAEACRLVSGGAAMRGEGDSIDVGYDLRHPFDAAFVSAFAEIFNNIVIHAYDRTGAGTIELNLQIDHDQLAVDVVDAGRPFDIDTVPSPELDDLPEGGMGIHIARTMLDSVEYEPGPPNKWRLVKRLTQPAAHAAGAND